MSNSVFKPGAGYTYQEEDARVIDMNNLVASKLEVLAQVMKQHLDESEPKAEDEDGFKALDAGQMERLFGDGSPVGDGVGEQADTMAEYAAEPMDLTAVNEQAEEILSGARSEADQILSDANDRAQGIRQQAKDEGYQEGFGQGRIEGLASVDEQKAELEQRQRELEADYEKKISELEPAFVEALSGIYEHIFHVDLSSRNDIVFHLLQDAIRKTESAEGYLIHVSRDDYENLISRRDELMAGIGSADAVEIIQDIGMASGQCSIETGGGIFDCSLDTQLEALKKELLLLSYNNG